jgi:hypothetical protein
MRHRRCDPTHGGRGRGHHTEGAKGGVHEVPHDGERMRLRLGVGVARRRVLLDGTRWAVRPRARPLDPHARGVPARPRAGGGRCGGPDPPRPRGHQHRADQRIAVSCRRRSRRGTRPRAPRRHEWRSGCATRAFFRRGCAPVTEPVERGRHNRSKPDERRGVEAPGTDNHARGWRRSRDRCSAWRRRAARSASVGSRLGRGPPLGGPPAVLLR